MRTRSKAERHPQQGLMGVSHRSFVMCDLGSKGQVQYSYCPLRGPSFAFILLMGPVPACAHGIHGMALDRLGAQTMLHYHGTPSASAAAASSPASPASPAAEPPPSPPTAVRTREALERTWEAEAAAAHLEAARREGARALAARQLGGARGVLIDGHGDRRDGVYRPEGEDHLGFPRFASATSTATTAVAPSVAPSRGGS